LNGDSNHIWIYNHTLRLCEIKNNIMSNCKLRTNV